ncbi:hypothetical protein THRCLA_09121 [Thraustotheca clavata]|uniref:RING-type domain-containing protein n=1 Tax=Thraustotheca clavata TaxID=74557 RepID=A0A1V9YZ83_9STRA|nr:hypothetical protein THRCLA_09121 [Thraustotheca clavata]
MRPNESLEAKFDRWGSRFDEKTRDIESKVQSGVSSVMKWVKNAFGSEDEKVSEAVRSNDVPGLIALLESLPPEKKALQIEYRSTNGRTPLMIGCAKNHLTCVQILLQHGAFIDARDDKGNAALHYACLQGSAEVLQFLVNTPGVSPYLQNQRGLSPIDVARKNVENQDFVQESMQCIDILQRRSLVFEAWVYESVDNIASSVIGMSALQSWATRYAMVSRVGSPLYLEIALYDVEDGHRSAVPREVIMFQIAGLVILNTKTKLFNEKPFAFTFHGARRKSAGFLGASQKFEFAAFDQQSYQIWTQFMTTQAAAAIVDPLLAIPAPPAYPSAWQQPPPVPAAIPISANTQAPPPVAPPKTLHSPSEVSSQAVAAASAPPFEEQHLTASSAPTLNPIPSLAEDRIPSECIVCFDGPQNAVCIPCGHAAICLKCADHIRQTTHQCPVCRADVREIIQLYHLSARLDRVGEHLNQLGAQIEEDVNAAVNSNKFSLSTLVNIVKTAILPSSMNSAVYNAARNNDCAGIVQALNDITNPETRVKLLEHRGSNGRTPLMVAAAKDHLACLELLLRNGANINAIDDQGNNALHYACFQGGVTTAQFLLSPAVGMTPFAQNIHGLATIDIVRHNLENGDHVPASTTILQMLTEQTQVFQGWIYESVDNIASAISGMDSLMSWTRRFAIVSRVGSPTYLEIAFYEVTDNQRKALPSSVFMLNVQKEVNLSSNGKIFNGKQYSFMVQGARMKGPGFVGMDEPLELAPLDELQFKAWSQFLTYDAVTQVFEPLPTAKTLESDSTPMQLPQHMMQPDAPSLPEVVVAASAPAMETLYTEPPMQTSFTAPAMEASFPTSAPECIVCCDGPQNAVCIPCGHAAMCMKCALFIQSTEHAECPVCRASVREIVQIFHV